MNRQSPAASEGCDARMRCNESARHKSASHDLPHGDFVAGSARAILSALHFGPPLSGSGAASFVFGPDHPHMVNGQAAWVW
jgi:hypothetical protein